MTDVLFIQGAGEGVHAEWDIRLVESLRRELGPRYDVRYPRMPDEGDPALETWVPAIARALAALGPGAIVVGHSAGATTLPYALADAAETARLAAIVLLSAPWFGEGGWASDDVPPLVEVAARLPDTVPVLLYHGEADAEVPVAHVERWAAAIPHARVRRLAGRDHQLNDDLSEVAGDLRAFG